MNYTISGYHIKQKRGISHWSSVLEEWILIIDRYCRVFDGSDAPYFYTELANVGLLASAAWRSGNIALQEFQSTKGIKYRPKWNGRVDLYLRHNQAQEEVLEAKLLNISMDAHKDLVTTVAEEMKKAVEDVKHSKINMDLTGLGAVFVVPNLTINNANKRIDLEETSGDWITEWIEELLAGNDYHAAAWCFPKEMRNYLQSDDPDIFNDNYAYPGVVLLIKNCDK